MMHCLRILSQKRWYAARGGGAVASLIILPRLTKPIHRDLRENGLGHCVHVSNRSWMVKNVPFTLISNTSA
jgi:hypothetical protein